jgi:DNA-binding XRE family transcriptional regulator
MAAKPQQRPVRHDHARFLTKARQRPGFTEAHESLELEYALTNQVLKARAEAGLTQEAVVERIGTPKSAISRLEATGRHAPSLATPKKHAAAHCDWRENSGLRAVLTLLVGGNSSSIRASVGRRAH